MIQEKYWNLTPPLPPLPRPDLSISYPSFPHSTLRHYCHQLILSFPTSVLPPHFHFPYHLTCISGSWVISWCAQEDFGFLSRSKHHHEFSEYKLFTPAAALQICHFLLICWTQRRQTYNSHWATSLAWGYISVKRILGRK